MHEQFPHSSYIYLVNSETITIHEGSNNLKFKTWMHQHPDSSTLLQADAFLPGRSNNFKKFCLSCKHQHLTLSDEEMLQQENHLNCQTIIAQ